MTHDAIEVPEDMAERVKWAEETMRMASELEEYVSPPWRWRKWHRLAKLIRARNAALQAANEETRRSLRTSP